MVRPLPLPLVPLPASAIVGEGRMPVTESMRVIGDSPAAIQLMDAVAHRTGIRLTTTDVAEPGAITLRVESGAAPTEGYRLSIGENLQIVGGDEAGLFYGVQTLLQLLTEESGVWSLPRVEITDAPRFPRRGVMLDVTRHFFDVAEVKRFIDETSALKYNHLHLHLSDDQGWRIQIDSWPKLTELSSASAADGDRGGFYTKDEYRDIVAYAAARHMIVIPEIDLPGHTHAIGVAYPDLVEEPVLNDALISQAKELDQPLPVKGEPYLGWGVGHSSVRIHEERTYDFVRDVIRELVELTPGPYIHIGGDESLGTPQADFDLFAERATAIVIEEGRIPVAWHEMGSAAGIAEGTVGQYWGMTTPSETHAAEAARFVERGGALIVSAADAAYLDMKYTPDFPLGLTWAAVVDVQRAYSWDPSAVLDVPDTAILGIEAPLWSETTRTYADVEQLVFPRAAALAEVAWSPQEGEGRDWESFRDRIATLAPGWRARGVNFHASPEIDWVEQ